MTLRFTALDFKASWNKIANCRSTLVLFVFDLLLFSASLYLFSSFITSFASLESSRVFSDWDSTQLFQLIHRLGLKPWKLRHSGVFYQWTVSKTVFFDFWLFLNLFFFIFYWMVQANHIRLMLLCDPNLWVRLLDQSVWPFQIWANQVFRCKWFDTQVICR